MLGPVRGSPTAATSIPSLAALDLVTAGILGALALAELWLALNAGQNEQGATFVFGCFCVPGALVGAGAVLVRGRPQLQLALAGGASASNLSAIYIFTNGGFLFNL